MKYYIIAGEPSGDLHGSNLMQGIKEADPSAEFRYYGGELMASKGGELAKHYKSLAFMGFLEVARNIRTVLANIAHCKKDLKSYNPDLVILIDYPGFNMRIARFAKKEGFRVFYYIAPKVWAWNESRVKSLRKYVDQLFVIFPFEVTFFKNHGITPIYEGNPLLDAIESAKNNGAEQHTLTAKYGLNKKPIITLLAGSRKDEIKHNLPTMLSLISQLRAYQFVIAGAPSIDPEVYNRYIQGKDVKVIYNQTYNLLRRSTVAVVTSGTATLEAALLGTPEVVCYRSSTPTMLIAWVVVKVKFISLVNLIMNREVVKELIQFDLTPNRLLDEVSSLLPGESRRDRMLHDFKRLKQLIGEPGSSYRVGKRIVELINPSK